MVTGMQIRLISLSTYIVIFLFVLSKVNGNPDNLITYLFSKNRYDKRIIPANRKHGPLNITVGFTVIHFSDLEEINQQLVTDGILHMSWSDPHLTWNPSDFNGTKVITVNVDKIWVPDVVLFNSAAGGFAKGLFRSDGLLEYNGKLTYDFRSIFHTICKINVDSYPIDKQECQLVFGSWGFHGGKLVVTSKDKEVKLGGYVINGEWELEKTSLKQHLTYYDGQKHPYYDITFTITIRRQLLYYAMYLIIPGTLVALIASTVFLLPLECSERVTVGMAVLVALSFFFLLVTENMPASSKVPLIGGYYAVTMLEMTISFFLNILILRFHHMTDEPVPGWVKKYILHYGARFLIIKFHDEVKQSQQTKKQLTSATKDMGHLVKRKLTEEKEISIELYVADKVVTTIFEEKIKNAKRDAEWKKAAVVLNDYALIFHIVVVIITFGAIFWKHVIFKDTNTE